MGTVRHMRDLVILAIHLLVTFAKLRRAGGIRAVAAESLLLKHQLLISNRSRQRTPNLTTPDRLVLGLTTLFVSPRRIPKLAALIKPATLFKFHKALVNRKYRLLFSSSSHRRKPGPKGPSVCRMFNRAIAGQSLPKRVSTDHDPLFRFHRWLANLRVLPIEEVKSVPYAPVSHPFIERLIGTIRREYLDQVFFWNAIDLVRKLEEFKDYYNTQRVHRALAGATPAQRAGTPACAPAAIDHYAWRQHCRGLFQIPATA